jgi:hypothetical protein
MDWLKLDDARVYTRKELRKMGFDYSSTQFLRWEKEGLRTIKAPGRSSRVHYTGANLKQFFAQ